LIAECFVGKYIPSEEFIPFIQRISSNNDNKALPEG